MAKNKSKNIISILRDYSSQIDLLTFDQAGILFSLIRKSESIYNPEFNHFEESLPMSDGCRMIWAFIKADLATYWDKQRKLSEVNAANARKRWGSSASSPADQLPAGQRSIIFSVPAAADSSFADPSQGLIAHASGMRSHPTASKNDATASDPMPSIYNNTYLHNTDNSAHARASVMSDCKDDPSADPAGTAIPDMEMIKQLFVNNGSNEAAAMDYYRYYKKRDFRTGNGQPIHDWQRSVRLWVERNDAYQKKQAEKQAAKRAAAAEKSDSAAKTQRTGKPGSFAAKAKKAKKAGAQFHNFDQRQYDFDELLRDLYPQDYESASSSSAADPEPEKVAYPDKTFDPSDYVIGEKEGHGGFHNFTERVYDYDKLLAALGVGGRKAVI